MEQHLAATASTDRAVAIGVGLAAGAALGVVTGNHCTKSVTFGGRRACMASEWRWLNFSGGLLGGALVAGFLLHRYLRGRRRRTFFTG